MRRNALVLLAALTIGATGCGKVGKNKPSVEFPLDRSYALAPIEQPLEFRSAQSTVEPFTYATSVADGASLQGMASHQEMASLDAMADEFPQFDNRAGVRYHTVTAKETLYGLARVYYHDQSRWRDIFAANRTVIGSDPDTIFVGQRLVIP